MMPRPGGSDQYRHSQDEGGHPAMYQGGGSHGGYMRGAEPRRSHHDAHQPGAFQEGHSEYRHSAGHEGPPDMPLYRAPGLRTDAHGAPMSGDVRGFPHGGQQGRELPQRPPEYRSHEGPQHSYPPPLRPPGPHLSQMERGPHPVNPPYGSGPEPRRFQHGAQQLPGYRTSGFGGHEGQQRSNMPPHSSNMPPHSSRMEADYMPGIPPHGGPPKSMPESRRFSHEGHQYERFDPRSLGGHEGPRSGLPPHRGPDPDKWQVGQQSGIPPHEGHPKSVPEPRRFPHDGDQYEHSDPRSLGGHDGPHPGLPPHKGPDPDKWQAGQQSGIPPHGGHPKSMPESRRLPHEGHQYEHSEHRSLGGHEGPRLNIPPHRGSDPSVTSKLQAGQKPGVPPHGGHQESRRFPHEGHQSELLKQGHSEYRSIGGQEGPHSDFPPHRGPDPNTKWQHGGQKPGIPPYGGPPTSVPELRRFPPDGHQSELFMHGHSEHRNFGGHEDPRSDLHTPHKGPDQDPTKMQVGQHCGQLPGFPPHGGYFTSGPEANKFPHVSQSGEFHQRPSEYTSGPDQQQQHSYLTLHQGPNSGSHLSRPDPSGFQHNAPPSRYGHSEYRATGFAEHDDKQHSNLPPHRGPSPDIYKMEGAKHNAQPSGFPPNSNLEMARLDPRPLQQSGVFQHGQSQAKNADFVRHEERSDTQTYKVPAPGGPMPSVPHHEGSHVTGPEMFHHGQSQPRNALVDKDQPHKGPIKDSYKIEGSQFRDQHPGAPLHGVSPSPHAPFTHPQGVGFVRHEELNPAVQPHAPNTPQPVEMNSSFGAPKPEFSNPSASLHRPPPSECNPHRMSPVIVQQSPTPFPPGPAQSVQGPPPPFPCHVFPPPFHVPPPNILFPPQMGNVCTRPPGDGKPNVSDPNMQREEHLSPFSAQKYVPDTQRDPQENFCAPSKNMETFKGPTEPSNRDLFQNWLSSFLAQRKKKPPAKPDFAHPIPISEARELVYGALNLVSQLSALCQTLEDHTGDGDSWALEYEKAADIRRELERRMKVLEKPGYIQSVKTKLERVRKKRLRCQRNKLAREEEEKEAAERASEKEARIDQWRMQRIHEVEEKKKERELKAAADSVLSEVRKKQTDAKKMLDVLKSLEKLRKLRKEAAARKGVSPPPAADETFKNHIDRLRSMVHKRMALYDAEERALRVIVEGEQEEERQRDKDKRLRKEREKILQKQRELDSLLFGNEEPLPALHPLQPFRQYYLQAENSVVSLVQIRHAWDRFLAPPDNPDASSIPRGWVLPGPPSSNVWATAIKQE